MLLPFSFRLPLAAPVALAALSCLALLGAPAAHAQNQVGDTETAQLAVGNTIYNGSQVSATFAAPITTLVVNLGNNPVFSVRYTASTIIVSAMGSAGFGDGFGFNGLQLINDNPRFSSAMITSNTFPGFDPATRFTVTPTQLNFDFSGLSTTEGQSLTVSLSPAATGAPEPGSLSLLGMGLVSGLGTLGIVRRKRRQNAA